MIVYMSTLTQTLFTEIEQAPEPVQQEVLNLLILLKTQGAQGAAAADNLLPLAASAWAADWDTPEEDAAWRDL